MEEATLLLEDADSVVPSTNARTVALVALVFFVYGISARFIFADYNPVMWLPPLAPFMIGIIAISLRPVEEGFPLLWEAEDNVGIGVSCTLLFVAGVYAISPFETIKLAWMVASLSILAIGSVGLSNALSKEQIPH